MSAHSNLVHESLETVLASAFAVQQSGMDNEARSALVAIQRSITTGELDVDQTMRLIADRARNVANASGIGIALLKADQLVYRAASGSAASYVGRQETAVLSVSAHKSPRREILRVDNAHTDARIEAAVCRQFEASSLLILPIYQAGDVAGVLEVFFSEAHIFHDPEVEMYQLMTGLVEKAMFRDIQLDQKESLTIQLATVPHMIEPITSQMEKLCSSDKFAPERPPKSSVDRLRATAAVREKLTRLWQPATGATTITEPLKFPLLETLRWNLLPAAVVIALVIATWIVRRPASPVEHSVQGSSSAARPQVSSAPSRQLPGTHSFKPQTAMGGTERHQGVSRSAFKRVRVGPNEIDYIAEDVTIRRFTQEPAPLQMRPRNKQIHIGEDVTVRYFEYTPAVLRQPAPLSVSAQSAESPPPTSK
jgi:putative methionine-R-sulfoxide reductase with GAF domain